MVNYQDGKIYRIPVGDDEYIGSTTQSLSQRLNCHKKASKKSNSKLYQTIRSLASELDGIKLYLLENYPCNSKEELEARERHWIEERKPSLNKNIPTRTRAEYRADNQEHIKQWNEDYRVKNAEKLKANRKTYKAENKEIIKESGKLYYKNNKDTILDKQKQKREANKEDFLAKEKIYRENNKVSIKNNAQKHYQMHKNEINEKLRNTVHHCDICNVDVKGSKGDFKKHCQRKYHIEKSNVIV